MRRLMPVILCLMAVTLAGCFEVEETVTLAPGGDATIQFLLRLPIAGDGGMTPGANPKDAAEELSKELTGFSSVDLRSSSTFGQTVVAVTAKAPSFSALTPFYGPLMKKKEKEKDKSQDALGALTPKSFYTMKRKGDRLFFTRTFTPPAQPKKKKQAEDEKNMAALMGMMGSVFMRFTLDVPGKVISSNAEEVSGTRLTWVIPASYLQTNKATLSAEIEASPELLKALSK